jgi:transposase-like protein
VTTIRERIAELLLEQGKTVTETAHALGMAKSTVSYHKRRLGLPMKTECNRRYDWSEVQRYYDKGYSARQCCRHFGCSAKTFHDAMKRGAIVCRPKAMSLDELLINGPRSRNNIKQRLIAAGLKNPRCENCGIARWRDRPLSLCLHHINGERHDNRLENLVLLCPNCHSQTPNFGSKNWRRRPE